MLRYLQTLCNIRISFHAIGSKECPAMVPSLGPEVCQSF